MYKYIGTCSQCGSAFYFETDGVKACKWGGCNGVITTKPMPDTRILIENGEMFDGNIAQFEDTFGGVQGRLEGVIAYCGRHQHALTTVINGITKHYSIYQEDGKWYYETITE